MLPYFFIPYQSILLTKLGDISDTILSGKDLIKSGIMNKMYEEEKRTGKEWTCITLKDWFIENDFKGHVYETYKAYNTKYKTVYNNQ